MQIGISKMLSIFILVCFSVVKWATSETCPASYVRLSKTHSYCMQPNPTCKIHKSGISNGEIYEILKLHNDYRSGVANGKESRAGGLPTASNMHQLEWDNELASVAQKWANNCVFQHDCNECRSVENFPVGQNIAYVDWMCPDTSCMQSIKEKAFKPDWAKVMKIFYDEVENFNMNSVQSMPTLGGKPIGHFTQMVWAKTWRVGCGFTTFVKDMGYRQLYVCNYGPGGNVLNEPIYEAGKPCSACPVNSCCGSSCTAPSYPGLCKMLDPSKAPVYSRDLGNLFFFCDSSMETKDCDLTADGNNKWFFKNSLQGNYLSIVLNGGESSSINFKKLLSPSENTFCWRLIFRKGPQIAGEQDQSQLSANFKPIGFNPVIMDLRATTNMYMPFDLDLSWKANTEFSITFSVAKGAGPHVLDIKEIMAFDGPCKARRY